MEHIRVSNLRCLADSGPIEIKPISLLVGSNSSGKSSFLRVFPLLKQSHETRTLGGLLLNEGDVNFGFFNEAIRRDANPPEMKLEFSFTMQQALFQGASWNNYLIEPIEITCELIYVARVKDHHYPRLRMVNLTLTTGSSVDKLALVFEEDGQVGEFSVNDFQSTSDERKLLRLRISRGLIPQLIVVINRQDSLDGAFDLAGGYSPFDKRLVTTTEAFFHGKTARETKLATFQNVRVGSSQKMLEDIRHTGTAKWKERVARWTEVTPAFQELRNLLLARRTNDILESVNLYVTQLAKSVHYFQPVRASAERDYVSRDVSVTSVNSTGLNVAMVLASLTTQDQRRFREWMGRYFGFEVFPMSVSDGARISLRMKESASGNEFNLADTGFGFSQMLPFLVQVWSITEGKSIPRRSYNVQYRFPNLSVPSSYIIAIEQPELHLHPAMQAKLADVIVAMGKLSETNQIPIRFILETHSQTIIERIGQSVEAGIIRLEDVQVVLFEADRSKPGQDISVVRTTSFDSQGVLQDWPFGFLSAPFSLPTTATSESDHVISV